MFNSGPLAVPTGEYALIKGLSVTSGRLADGRVTEAEARSAAERVLRVQVEEARLAAVATLSLDVLLAFATT